MMCSVVLGLVSAVGCSSEGRHPGTETDASFIDAAANDAGRAGSERRPPPISGGTLLVTRDGLRAIAADPDTDRVVIVGLSGALPGCEDCGTTPSVLANVELRPGEEPGRLVDDGAGLVHVVLRRGGAIATIDLASGQLLARRPVCPAPRGIAFDDRANLLHVACASGELVSLSPASGTVKRRVSIDRDLRDVVVVPDGLVVSRFKTAELIRIDPGGNVVGRIEPRRIERGPLDLSHPVNDPLEPAVAWRTASVGDGSVYMLHQYGLARPIDLGSPGAVTAPSSPYAAKQGGRCGGVVEQTISVLSPGGDLDMGMPMPVLALSVDVAASSDGTWLAVAHPGARSERVTLYHSADLATLGRSPVRCADDAGRVVVDGQPVAVALLPGRIPAALADYDWLIVQTRAPAGLQFYRGFATARVTVPLGGRVARDFGHDLFHVDSGGGIACAQCHPEGAEDGRVWQFSPLGNRRTQAVHVGLEGTEPFHWSGNLLTLRGLVDEVYVRRMGGQSPAPWPREELGRWLFSLAPPPPIADGSAKASVRGRALFDSSEVGCGACHAGPKIAKNTSEDVGVESPKKFQIPSLHGVGYRAPFLHNGCASTLRDRFDPACGGGDLHGKTSQLSSAQIDDLIAYLESL